MPGRRSVRQRLKNVEKELPKAVTISCGADQSRFIEASIREVLSNAAIGGLVAIMVLMLFLKDLRSTLIIGISIPISIVATFFLMYHTGTTLNIMSLGGLALGGLAFRRFSANCHVVVTSFPGKFLQG